MSRTHGDRLVSIVWRAGRTGTGWLVPCGGQRHSPSEVASGSVPPSAAPGPSLTFSQ